RRRFSFRSRLSLGRRFGSNLYWGLLRSSFAWFGSFSSSGLSSSLGRISCLGRGRFRGRLGRRPGLDCRRSFPRRFLLAVGFLRRGLLGYNGWLIEFSGCLKGLLLSRRGGRQTRLARSGWSCVDHNLLLRFRRLGNKLQLHQLLQRLLNIAETLLKDF